MTPVTNKPPVTAKAQRPSLLLLPGLMCDHTFWQPLLDIPPMGVRCTAVDYGEADSIMDMARAVLDVAPPKFSLAGHSMGGRVALEVVRLAPERVEQLIIMDTGYLSRLPGEKGDAEKASRMALMAIAEKQGVRAMAREWVKGMVHPSRLDDAELIERIVAMFARKNAARFSRQQHALLSRPDASDVLAWLDAQCLILCGRQDAWADVTQHEAMRDLTPDATLRVIEDAGHMVLMEQPDATLQAIHEFMGQRLLN